MQTVVVTGATQGIGLACTRALLKRGFRVHGVSRHPPQDALPDGFVWSQLDLASRASINAWASRWSRPVHGLLNNAGKWLEERVDDPETGVWDATMRLNVDGVYFLTKALQRHIVDNGRIVNVSSQLGTRGRAAYGPYAASKHAVIGLTRCWAAELASRAITVNAVCPGWVRTESNLREFRALAELRGTSAHQEYNAIASDLTLGRFIEADEVARLVVFLMSTEASGITGQIYEIR